MGNILKEDNIKSIYNYTPAYNNLYEVTIMPFTYSTNVYGIENYLTLHATNVTFNGDILNLDRNEVTKNFQVSDNPYSRTDTLSITWREDDLWKVKRYHDEWLSKFYNREEDYFYSKSSNAELELLYRTIKIVLPSPYKGDNETKPVANFNYVLPKNTGGLSLSWGSGGSVVTHSLDYYVTEWSFDLE